MAALPIRNSDYLHWGKSFFYCFSVELGLAIQMRCYLCKTKQKNIDLHAFQAQKSKHFMMMQPFKFLSDFVCKLN